LFINLTPLIPLPYKGGGRIKKEGLRPSKTPCNVFGGWRSSWTLPRGGELKRGGASFGWEGGKKDNGKQGGWGKAIEKRNMVICITNLSELAR